MDAENQSPDDDWPAQSVDEKNVQVAFRMRRPLAHNPKKNAPHDIAPDEACDQNRDGDSELHRVLNQVFQKDLHYPIVPQTGKS